MARTDKQLAAPATAPFTLRLPENAKIESIWSILPRRRVTKLAPTHHHIAGRRHKQISLRSKKQRAARRTGGMVNYFSFTLRLILPFRIRRTRKNPQS
ncbi:hypothetical protein Zmor_025759 [Zophobas morio]|uniref:Uncharacterized protein n=1 Tax=Zophobas morio TaxID=2755281 RepID=A0AA38HXN2_9CUCU|nr:hypothetical protein Zmor_025759 [Zophobas morio]